MQPSPSCDSPTLTAELSTVDDLALLHRWQQGDESALSLLVTRHAGLVHRCCRRQLSADAVDDAVQAVFLVLAGRAQQAATVPVLEAWLLGVARHICHNAARVKTRRQHHEQTFARLPLAKASAVIPAELIEHLDQALATLPGHEREAIAGHFLAGIPQAELARRCHCATATMRSRVHRGLKRLRGWFEQRDLCAHGAFGTLLPLALANEHQAALATAAQAAAQLVHLASDGTAAVTAPSTAASALAGYTRLVVPALVATLGLAVVLGISAWACLREPRAQPLSTTPIITAAARPAVGGTLSLTTLQQLKPTTPAFYSKFYDLRDIVSGQRTWMSESMHFLTPRNDPLPVVDRSAMPGALERCHSIRAVTALLRAAVAEVPGAPVSVSVVFTGMAAEDLDDALGPLPLSGERTRSDSIGQLRQDIACLGEVLPAIDGLWAVVVTTSGAGHARLESLLLATRAWREHNSEMAHRVWQNRVVEHLRSGETGILAAARSGRAGQALLPAHLLVADGSSPLQLTLFAVDNDDNPANRMHVVLVAGGVPGRGTFALLEDGTCMWFPGDAGYQWAQQQHAMHPPFPQIGNSRSGLESPVISGSHFAIASRGTW